MSPPFVVCMGRGRNLNTRDDLILCTMQKGHPRPFSHYRGITIKLDRYSLMSGE